MGARNERSGGRLSRRDRSGSGYVVIRDRPRLDRQLRGRPPGMEEEFGHLAFELHERGKVVEGIRSQIPVAADDQGDPAGVFPAVQDEVLTAALKDPRGQHVFCIGGIWKNEEAPRTILSWTVQAQAGNEL